MTRFPSTRNLPEPSVLPGAEVPGGSPLKGGGTRRNRPRGSDRNPLEFALTCPMCSAGRRESVVDGRAIACPWCGARGRVRLERARALRAQLRSKAEREAAR
jgi:hypothetical protein